MPTAQLGNRNILVATDFSAASEAAAKLAVWIADQNGADIMLAHALSDLVRVVHHSSYQARIDLLYGEGGVFERELLEDSDSRLKQLLHGLNRAGISSETLLGEPFVEIIHAVQQEGYDLVVTGSRGLSAWRGYFVGSTAKRLIRNCPCSVWIAKPEHALPPKNVLVATDLSDVSRRAVEEGLWVAERAGAEFHLLHVIDSDDVPNTLLKPATKDKPSQSFRQQLCAEAKKRIEEFVTSLQPSAVQIQIRLAWGTPWREIRRLVRELNIDLVVLGTVGRSGIPGVLLGNTAERVLTTCNASILTVKPAGFVSPIPPPSWALHPVPAKVMSSGVTGYF